MIENGLSSLKTMYLFSRKRPFQRAIFGQRLSSRIVSISPEETLTHVYFQAHQTQR